MVRCTVVVRKDGACTKMVQGMGRAAPETPFSHQPLRLLRTYHATGHCEPCGPVLLYAAVRPV